MSCIHYKFKVVNDPHNPGSLVEQVKEELKVGDFITLKLYNRTFYNLEVTHIQSPLITVKQYLPHHNEYRVYDIHLEYIQELTVEDLEMEYPVGGPVTALLILFYLLV